jgi:CrcB protein
MKLVIAIALGGSIGALSRYYTTLLMANIIGLSTPWATIFVNVMGALVLGFLVEIFLQTWSPTAEMKAFLTIGLLGAFTTFSAFSLDSFELYERGEHLLMLAYIVGSVMFSILALLVGLRFGRLIFS